MTYWKQYIRQQKQQQKQKKNHNFQHKNIMQHEKYNMSDEIVQHITNKFKKHKINIYLQCI